MSINNPINFIDLFAGIGGFRYALEYYSDAKCVFTSEWDKHAQKTYQDNFGEIPNGDITQINENDIPSHDVLCAGFPCQAFSVSGKQRGFEDTRGTLFFDVARIAEFHSPKVLFLENVKNFQKHDDGKTLLVVKNTLEKIGYNLYSKLFNASHFGLPQNRERFFMVAIRKDLDNKKFEFPKPPMINVKLKDILLSKEETQNLIITNKDININANKVLISPDPSGNFPLKPIRIGEYRKGGQGERIYHELGHAITLSAYGGGIGAKTGLYLIDGKIRKLHPRECARIQGFPEQFIIHENKNQAYKQFGNSVPINIITEIYKNIKKSIF
jgi:DNA (cytosine-5)-methyltransferase 1